MSFTPVGLSGARLAGAARTSSTRSVSARASVGGGGSGSGNGLRRTGGGGSGDGNARRGALSFASAVASAALFVGRANAAPKKPDPKAAKKGAAAAVKELTGFDLAKQCSTTAGLSAAVGYGSGMLVKALASGALIILAGTFAFLKWLETQQLITVNWKNVESFWAKQTKLLDQNGDGKLDAKDLQVVRTRFEGFMATTVPSAGGFAAGFMLGIKP